MAFTVRTDLQQDLRRVRDLAESLPGRLHRAQNSIGFYLVAQERQHFLQLTRTGESNGVRWAPPSPATMRHRREMAKRGLLADPAQIGVLTGRMAAGFRFRVQGNSVRLTNVVPYQGPFGDKRPIFPPSIPAAWLSGCVSIVDRRLNRG